MRPDDATAAPAAANAARRMHDDRQCAPIDTAQEQPRPDEDPPPVPPDRRPLPPVEEPPGRPGRDVPEPPVEEPDRDRPRKL